MQAVVSSTCAVLAGSQYVKYRVSSSTRVVVDP